MFQTTIGLRVLRPFQQTIMFCFEPKANEPVSGFQSISLTDLTKLSRHVRRLVKSVPWMVGVIPGRQHTVPQGIAFAKYIKKTALADFSFKSTGYG